MPTLSEIAETYGLSKTTARRRIHECFPDREATGSGKALVLTPEEGHVFADWMGKRGQSPKQAATPEPEAKEGAPEQTTRDSVADQVTIAVQAERIRGLEDRVLSLETEVERLHAALEREQEKAPAPQVGLFGRIHGFLTNGRNAS